MNEQELTEFIAEMRVSALDGYRDPISRTEVCETLKVSLRETARRLRGRISMDAEVALLRAISDIF